MSRLDYRGGTAPLRTAAELAVILPVPLLMIVGGFAAPTFPLSTPSSPSPFVRIVNTKLRTTHPRVGTLPLDVHWKQWESVCVPLLSDGRLSAWRGQIDLLCAITLTNSIVGPGGVVVPGGEAGSEIGLALFCNQRAGHLFSCDANDVARATGKTGQYLELVMKLVQSTASEAGY